VLDTPNRLAVDLAPEATVKVLAGISEDKRTVRILMTNPSKSSQTVQIKFQDLPWNGSSTYEQQVVSDRYDLQSVGGSKTSSSPEFKQDVAGQSVVLLTIRPSAL
jgi:hypothetical protein